MTINVLLVENNLEQLEIMRTVILNRIAINPTLKAYDMHIALCTSDPYETIDYIRCNKFEDYFGVLDIDLNSDVSGIEIAEELRKTNGFTEICYVSAYEDFLLKTINSNTKPIDFIYKSQGIEQMIHQLRRAIDLVYFNYTKLVTSHNMGNMFTYEPFIGLIKRVPVDEILYIKTTNKQHKLELVCKDRTVEFYGELKSIEAKRNNFIRVGRQILINLDNVISLNVKERRVYFLTSSDEMAFCKVSLRKIPAIKRILLSEK